MFSFVGDTVLDPFAGTGTTNVAAAMSGRNSIGVEIDRAYFGHAVQRFERECVELFGNANLEVHAD
jgi:site-specific DNA-methyltransferase (adenine-specific)